MFWEYVTLVWLLIVVVVLVYIFFYIHDIPYEVAKHRNHPQADAIYAGCWLSLFTLHAIWPFIFMWALMKSGTPSPAASALPPEDADALRNQISALNAQLADLESAKEKRGRA